MEKFSDTLIGKINKIDNPILDNSREETIQLSDEAADINVINTKNRNDLKQKVENLSSGEKHDISMEEHNLTYNVVDSIHEKYNIKTDKNWTEQDGKDLVNSKEYDFLTLSNKEELLNNRNTSFDTMFQSINKMKNEYEHHKQFEQFDTVDSLLYGGAAMLLDPTNLAFGFGAYKAAGSFALKSMFKSNLAMHATTFTAEAAVSGLHETGLYYTNDFKTVEGIGYATLFGGLIGGPLSKFGISSEITTEAKQLKTQLDLYTKSKSINDLTEINNMRFDVEPLGATIRLEKDGKVAFLNQKEYSLLKEDINNIDNIKFKSYTKEELDNKLNTKSNDGYNTFGFNALDFVKKEIKGDEEASKIADKFFSSFREGGAKTDSRIKMRTDAYEGEIGNAFKNAKNDFKKDYPGENMFEFTNKAALEINNGIKVEKDFPEYMQNIFNVIKKGDEIKRLENLKNGIETPIKDIIHVSRNIEHSKAKAMIKNMTKEDIKKMVYESVKSSYIKKLGADYDEILGDKLAKKMSDVYYKVIDDVAYGKNPIQTKQNAVSSDLNKSIDDIILEGEDGKDIGKLIEQLEYVKNKDRTDAKLPGEVKHRMEMDTLYNYKNEKGDIINLNDVLFNNNLLNNSTESFRRSVSNSIFTQDAKVTYKGKDYDLSIPSDLANYGKATKSKKFSELILHLKTGKITEKLVGEGGLNKTALILRNTAVAEYMGKGFFAAMPELSMALGKSMMTSGFKNIPLMLDLWKTLKLGKTLKTEQSDFMDIIGWYMTSASEKNSKTILQSGGDAIGSNKTFLDKVVHGSDVAADFVARKVGAIAFMDTFSKLLVSTSELQRLRNLAIKGKDLFPNAKRLKASNFTSEEINTLKKALIGSKDKNAIESFKEMDNILDKELSEKFIHFITRKTDSIINNPTIGESVLLLQDNLIGKTAFQFMTYTATSYGKLTQAGLYYADAEAISLTASAYMGSALGQMSRIYTDTIGDKEGRKKRMELDSLAWKTLAGTSQMATPAWIMQSVMNKAGHDLNSGRSSGLKRGIQGAASLDLYDKLTNSVIDSVKDGHISVKTLRGFTPLFLGSNSIYHYLGDK